MDSSGLERSDKGHFYDKYIPLAIVAGLVLFAIGLNILQSNIRGAANWLVVVGGVAIMLAASRRIGLKLADLGLAKADVPAGLRYGSAAVAIIVAVLGLAFMVHPAFFADSRYNDTTAQVLVAVFFFIPFHTVFTEELLFRGVLLGYFSKHLTERKAAVGSSVLFGLWHILPSLGIAKSSQTISGAIGTGSGAQAASIVGVVLVTFVAGLVFCWLRIRSKSLLAPFLAHWAINAVALVFASLA